MSTHHIADDLNVATDRDTALEGVRALLRLMGEDPDREGLQDTPARVVKAYLEMADRPGDPEVLLAKTFGDVTFDAEQMIAVGPVEFTSMCEHHLLPFTGRAWVAYIPADGRVVGLSKLPRLVEHIARRPQVQERLTAEIADMLEAHLRPRGVGVVVQATHACMALRGVRKVGAEMTTSALRGYFKERPETRAEFMALTRH